MPDTPASTYGHAVKNVTKGVDPKGLYDTSTTKLGQSKGLRQNYRWGLYREFSAFT